MWRVVALAVPRDMLQQPFALKTLPPQALEREDSRDAANQQEMEERSGGGGEDDHDGGDRGDGDVGRHASSHAVVSMPFLGSSLPLHPLPSAANSAATTRPPAMVIGKLLLLLLLVVTLVPSTLRVISVGLWLLKLVSTGQELSTSATNFGATQPDLPFLSLGTNDVPALALAASCAQELPLAPSSHPALDQVFASYYDGSNTSFTDALAQKLSGMVRIQTVSFDDMKTRPVEEPLPDDPRRLGLYELRSYLKATWPQLHSKLELDIVNRYSLVYTWKGSDPSLKPLLLAAHQDTVPVPSDTVDRWTYPPFDGIIADGRIWGRGTSDCKGQLAAILEAAENLVINGFQPRRTLVFAFGFDEEISGIQGAAIMAEYFESIYGVNGIAMIVDEGTGLEEAFGTTFAYLAISEKGAVSVRFSVSTPGGHASVPPAHTGIGILSLLVVNLEANPFPLSLGTDENESPLLQQLRCEAAHAPLMPNDLRETISRVDRSVGAEKDEAKRELANKLAVDPIYKAVMSTTQAVDLISGGIKVNALPELATATANYRIAADSSIAKTEDRLFQLTKSVAAAFNMTLTQKMSSGEEREFVSAPPETDPYGTIRIVSESAPMEPSRKTPVDGKPYKVMAGTVLHALKRENEPLFVSPSSPTFNTDTRFYHRLSEHIFRFSPPRSRASQRMHTVDENLVAVDLVASSGFFFDLIRNADEAQL